MIVLIFKILDLALVGTMWYPFVIPHGVKLVSKGVINLNLILGYINFIKS